MRLLSTLPILVVVLVVGGCGGGSAKTVTVTDVSTSATTAPPSPTDQLRAYLVAMKKAEREWNHAQHVWTKDDPKHTYADTAPWPKIGHKLVKVRQMFDESAIYVTSVTPPPGLLKAHRSWLSSIKLTSAEVDNYVTGFEDKNATVVYRLDNSPARLNEIGTDRTGWRLAVIARANELGVKVPKALRTVGSGY